MIYVCLSVRNEDILKHTGLTGWIKAVERYRNTHPNVIKNIAYCEFEADAHGPEHKGFLVELEDEKALTALVLSWTGEKLHVVENGKIRVLSYDYLRASTSS